MLINEIKDKLKDKTTVITTEEVNIIEEFLNTLNSDDLKKELLYILDNIRGEHCTEQLKNVLARHRSVLLEIQNEINGQD